MRLPELLRLGHLLTSHKNLPGATPRLLHKPRSRSAEKQLPIPLEEGLLSIHSCAITWQAVVLAHFKALEKLGDYSHYTETLVLEAQKLEKQAFRIHDWLEGRTALGADTA